MTKVLRRVSNPKLPPNVKVFQDHLALGLECFDLDWFDFSNYNKDHENYNADNHLVPGKMKDEMGGKIINEFVGLRSKMYSITVENQSDKRAAKGFLRNIISDMKII